MKLIAITLIAALTAGCATTQGAGANYSPVVDRPGPTYYADLTDCQAHARKVQDAANGAVVGAVAGAIFGALLGAAAGGDNNFNRQMAGVGALSGGVSAAADAEGGQRGIIIRCLTGRGHTVLQ